MKSIYTLLFTLVIYPVFTVVADTDLTNYVIKIKEATDQFKQAGSNKIPCLYDGLDQACQYKSDGVKKRFVSISLSTK